MSYSFWNKWDEITEMPLSYEGFAYFGSAQLPALVTLFKRVLVTWATDKSSSTDWLKHQTTEHV